MQQKTENACVLSVRLLRSLNQKKIAVKAARYGNGISQNTERHRVNPSVA